MSMDDIFKLPRGDQDLTDVKGKRKVKKKKGKRGLSAKRVTGGIAFELEGTKGKGKGKGKFIDTPYGRFPV